MIQEFKDILTYIETLLANPSDFELNKHVHEENILALLNRFADSRLPTIDQMVELLEEQYPGLQSSVDLIEKGDALRTEMMDRVFSEEFALDEVKKYEARISLFDKMIGFDNTINTLIKNIGGSYIPKKKAKTKIEVDGSQGSAQSLLAQYQTDGKKS